MNCGDIISFFTSSLLRCRRPHFHMDILHRKLRSQLHCRCRVRTQPQARSAAFLAEKLQHPLTLLAQSSPSRLKLGLNLLRPDTKPLACEYVNFFWRFLTTEIHSSARDSVTRFSSRRFECVVTHSFHSRDRTHSFSSMLKNSTSKTFFCNSATRALALHLLPSSLRTIYTPRAPSQVSCSSRRLAHSL